LKELSDKVIMVTGASSGIGLQVAQDLARHGARVIGAGRDAARCEAARQRILNDCPEARIDFLVADLSSQQQVKELAREAKRLSGGRLDALVNNAGLYSSSKKITEDGVELTFAVNHLAPFLLTHELLPVLSSSLEGRVLTISSASHYRATYNPPTAFNPLIYVGLLAYAATKLSNVLFSAEFNRRVSLPHLHAWAIDPGLVNTEIALKDNGALSGRVWKARKKHGTSPDVPSRTILHLISAAYDEIGESLYWKDSQPKKPSSKALDPDLARDLWVVSCRLCGISDYFNA
jgi:NAD(P)-dependent dehydrogenase (short-subunit alcohol dehydrogenase family)